MLVKLMSEPDVPTVKPVTISVPPVAVRIRAAAAVPDAAAVAFLGKLENVNTPPDTVPAVASKVMVARIDAMPVVPISSTPVAPIWVTTADKRAFFTVVE